MGKTKYNKSVVPLEVADSVDEYIQSLRSVSWMAPSEDLTSEDIEKQAKKVIKAFGSKGKVKVVAIESRDVWNEAVSCEFKKSWLKAWDAKYEEIIQEINSKDLDKAREVVWHVAKSSAWESAILNPWFSTWTSAWIAGLASLEVLIDKKGAFSEFLELYKMGVFPVGIEKETKEFLVYVPMSKQVFPNL